MARENSIFVRIRADGASFFNTMRQARGEMAKTQKSFKEYGNTVDEQRAKANALRSSYHELSSTFLTTGAVIVGGLGLMAAEYSRFDKALSVFEAHTEANKEQLAALGEQAMKTGHQYGIGAVEAVDAATALAKAGIEVEDVLGGGLEGALTLAATGNMNVADSAETAAIAMTQFGLSGEDVPHIVDLLSAAAAKSVGEVRDMSWALRQVGLVANSSGWELEETTGTLAAFAKAGLIGSDAGTSLKSMLLALQSPSGVATEKMESLGLSFYDANGEMLNAAGIAQELNDKLWHLTQEQRNAALATIFGQDAIRSANILYEQGADGINDWTAKVNDSGFAAELAADKMDNLQGDVSKLVVSFQNLIYDNGGGFNEFVRGIVQAADWLLQTLAKIPTPIYNTGLVIAGLVGAGALGVGAFMKLTVAAADTKDALKTLGISMDRTKGKARGFSRAIGGMAKAGAVAGGIAVLASAMLLLASAGGPASQSAAEIEAAISDMSKGIEPANKLFREAEWANGNKKSMMGTVEGINSIGDAVVRLNNLDWNESFSLKGNEFLSGLTNGAYEAPMNQMAEQLETIDNGLASMVGSGHADQAAQQFRRIISSVEASGGSVEDAKAQFTGYADAIREYGRTLGLHLTDQQVFNAMMGDLPPALVDAAGGAENAAAGIGEMGAAASDTAASLEDVLDAMFALGLINMDAREASIEYTKALSEVDAAAQSIIDSGGKLGATLNGARDDFNETSEAGVLAHEAYLDYAKSGMDVVKANAQLDGSFKSVRGDLKTTYDDLVAAAEKFGITGDAARNLAQDVMGVPEGVDIETWMDDEATKVAKATGGAVDEIPDHKNITIDTNAPEATVELDKIRVGLGDIPNDKEIRTLVTDNGSIDVVQIGVDNLTGKRVVAEVSDDGTVSATQYLVDTMDGKTILTPVSDGGSIPATQDAVNRMHGNTLRTIVTDDGTISLTQQEVWNMQGRIIETKVTDDGTIMVVQGGIDGMQDGDATIWVDDQGTARIVQQDISNTTGKTVYIDVIERYSSIGRHASSARDSYGVLAPPRKAGGRFHDLPGHADGFRLPKTGPGTERTDGFLAVDMYGRPAYRSDGGEWIIRSDRAEEYDSILAAINNGTYLKGLPGHATGAWVGHAATGSAYTPRPTPPVATTQTHMGIDYGRLGKEVANALAATPIEAHAVFDRRTATKLYETGRNGAKH